MFSKKKILPRHHSTRKFSENRRLHTESPVRLRAWVIQPSLRHLLYIYFNLLYIYLFNRNTFNEYTLLELELPRVLAQDWPSNQYP